MVVGDVSDKINLPTLVGLIAQIGLVVEIVRLVFSLGFHRTEQIGRSLVSHTVEPGQLPGSQSYVGICSEQAGSNASFNNRALSFRP